MTPPKKFWPFDDDELEIYDNPFWDLPGRTRQPDNSTARRVPVGSRLFLREPGVGLHFV